MDRHLTSEFSPEPYCTQNNNNIASDLLRLIKGNYTIPQAREQIYDYLFSKNKDASGEEKITHLVLLIGGAGVGKSTLMQSVPELKQHVDNKQTITDDNAASAPLLNTIIKRATDDGMTVEVCIVGCPISHALERVNNRAKKYNPNRTIDLHAFAHEAYMRAYAEWGRHSNVSFWSLINPRSAQENLRESGYSTVEIEEQPDLKNIVRCDGDVAFRNIYQNKLLAFGSAEADQEIVDDFLYDHISTIPEIAWPLWLESAPPSQTGDSDQRSMTSRSEASQLQRPHPFNPDDIVIVKEIITQETGADDSDISSSYSPSEANSFSEGNVQPLNTPGPSPQGAAIPHAEAPAVGTSVIDATPNAYNDPNFFGDQELTVGLRDLGGLFGRARSDSSSGDDYFESRTALRSQSPSEEPDSHLQAVRQAVALHRSRGRPPLPPRPPPNQR